MSKSRRRPARIVRRVPPGAPPGTLSADPRAPKPVVRMIAVRAEPGNGRRSVVDQEIRNIEELGEHLKRDPLVWVNVDGLGDADKIAHLGRVFGLHPLALEDVINVHQRPKLDPFEKHLFFVMRIVRQRSPFRTEQVSLFLGKNFVVTFLEDPGDCFDPVRQRLLSAQGHMRAPTAAYLAYALVDAAIDGFFPLLEEIGDHLEDLEDDVTLRPYPGVLAKVHGAKHELRALRRIVWSLRDAVLAFSRDPSPLVDDETRVYLRDGYDHTVQIIELVETFRELGADLTDLYMSSLSNRLNEVMKVLTIIATVFMPMSFIAALYGMNFDTKASPWNMPELGWRFGYFLALGMMITIGLGMLAMFARWGWIRDRTGLVPLKRELLSGDE